MNLNVPPHYVRLSRDLLPNRLNREVLERFAGIHIRNDSDGAIQITTQEHYRRTAGPQIDVALLARGNQFIEDGLRRIDRLTPITVSTPAAHLQAMRESRDAYVQQQSDSQPFWARFVGEVQLADDNRLVETLRNVQSAEGAAGASLWVLNADPLFSQRLSMMRGFFAARHAHEAWATNDGQASEGFPAARALMMNSTASFARFLQPPFLYGSPWVWAAVTARIHATFVQVFDSPEMGRDLGWGSPLDPYKGRMYEGVGVPTPPREPIETQETREQFMAWWTEKTEGLLNLLADFTRYRDEQGNYRPELHFGTVLTVERLFVSALELMRLKTQGEMVRILLLFDVLDLLDGHGLGNHEKNLHYTRQHTDWTVLRQTLPPAVDRCLSELIEGGFEALLEVDQTLWARSRIQDATLLVARKNGQGQEGVGLDRARGEYLHILRDAHHGFRKLVNNRRDLSYLACFTGALSARLPDLVWWYLIRLLNKPEVLVPFQP
jgi:hypothetical protein